MRRRLPGAVLFAFLSALLAIAVGAAARAESAADSVIAVAGNRHTDAAMIRSYFHVAPGRPLDAAALDAALKSLYASGLFADVKITRDGDRVLVTVVENPTIEQIAFEGNKKIKDADLKKALQSKAGGPLSRFFVQSRRPAPDRALSPARLFPGANHPRDDRRQERRGRCESVRCQEPRRQREKGAGQRRARQPRLPDQGRRQARGAQNPVRRQPRFSAVQAQRRDQDRQDEFSEFFARQRHLRCRQDRQRLRSVAPLLPRPRLRRRARPPVCELRRKSQGRRAHVHARRRAALSLRQGRDPIAAENRSIRRLTGNTCARMPATLTTPTRRTRRSTI